MSFRRYTRDLPCLESCDVIVCGGGPSGVAAALAARRSGAKVLLLEQTAQLGGVGTSGGVTMWLGGRTPQNEWCVGGVFRELVDALLANGGAADPLAETPGDARYTPFGWNRGLVHGVTFNVPPTIKLLDDKMAAAGVDLLYDTAVVDAVVRADRITHVVIHNKSGLQTVPVGCVIDATGDADVAARSGCDVTIGRDEDHLMTPATLMFSVDRVDRQALWQYIDENDTPRFRELIKTLRQTGEWTFPYEIFISFQVVDDDVFMINTSRLCDVDGLDGASITQGIIRGRQETMRLFDLMQRHFPGFSRARLRWIAPHLGIRETRRIVGGYMMTVDDVVSARDFDDVIGYTSYGWDLPDPKKPSCQPMNENQVAKPRFTPIPYRIMVPKPVTNLICPGRAVSVERDVLGPLRVMAPCFAMGEAAGIAAAWTAAENGEIKDVDVKRLQGELKGRNAIVDL